MTEWEKFTGCFDNNVLCLPAKWRVNHLEFGYILFWKKMTKLHMFLLHLGKVLKISKKSGVTNI